MIQMRERPSPNFGPRSGGIDMLVLHYTGMTSAEAALERLCSPDSQVSAHYLIAEDGTVWRLVPEAQRAWHAGVSSWRGRRDINGCAIGIELANPGHEWGYVPFPEPQMRACEVLCHEILARHPIPPRHILGHSDVAPQRKPDPGELFDWARLARAGIGLFPAAPSRAAETIAEAQRLLADFGYACPQSGRLDTATRHVIVAFQRHFRPTRCDGAADAETCGLIRAVAQLSGEI